MSTLILVLALSLPSATDLLGLAAAPSGPGLPPEWRLRPVSGVPAPDFSIYRGSTGQALKIGGRGAAAWAYRELPTPLADEAGRLRWSWRALEAPQGAELASAAADDAPLRVYVVFGKPRLFGRSRAIFYSWSAAGVGEPTLVNERLAVVPIAGPPGGGWSAESVRPFADFRRIWPGEPPPIHVVGVMQDTDDTGSTATAELRSLVWEPPRRGS